MCAVGGPNANMLRTSWSKIFAPAAAKGAFFSMGDRSLDLLGLTSPAREWSLVLATAAASFDSLSVAAAAEAAAGVDATGLVSIACESTAGFASNLGGAEICRRRICRLIIPVTNELVSTAVAGPSSAKRICAPTGRGRVSKGARGHARTEGSHKQVVGARGFRCRTRELQDQAQGAWRAVVVPQHGGLRATAAQACAARARPKGTHQSRF